MSPEIAPKTKGEALFDWLDEAIKRGITDFEIRKAKREAEALKETDLPVAFTILGIVYCLEDDFDNMHDSHINAIAYSSGDSLRWAKEQYFISVFNSYEYQRAYDFGNKLLSDYPDNLRIIIDMIHICKCLGKKDEYESKIRDWEKLSGKKYNELPFDEDNPKIMEMFFKRFDQVIEKRPELLIKPDPSIISLAEELIEGVDIN